MESPSLPQKEPQEEPGPSETGTEPPAESGADEVPPSESVDEDAARERGDE
jgi:hypothetical protein